MTRHLRDDWKLWETSVPLEIIDSPYRDVIGPLGDFIRKQAAGKQAH